MTGRQLSVLLAILLLSGLMAGSIYTVKDWEKVVVVRFGEVVATNCPPGLHFKLPVADALRRFDGRLLTLGVPVDGLTTKDGQALTASLYIRWRILDIDKYFRESGGDENKLPARISSSAQKAISDEFATHTAEEVIAGVSPERMKTMVVVLNRDMKDSGLEIIDLRLKRVDLPDADLQAVYGRMLTERRNAVAEVRARGDAEAVQARAEAERQREVILAEGYRQSEEIRADGDAQSGEIYSNAYGRNPEFYSFYRSLGVYQNSLNSKGDILVLEPDGELFRYFNPPTAQH